MTKFVNFVNKINIKKQVLSNFEGIFSTTAFQVAIFASGLAINKCIALFSGPLGIALFGVIKNFYRMASSFLMLGSATVIINKAAAAANSNILQKELAFNILKLTLLQSIAALLSIFFLKDLIYTLVFVSVIPESFAWIVQMIIMLILFSVFAEMMASFFNGLLELKKVFIASLSGSFVTLLLAIILKPTSFVALSFLALSSGLTSSIIMGFFLFQKLSSMRSVQSISDSEVFSKLPIAPSLLLVPLLVSTSVIIIQNLISGEYGLEALATYTLCVTLIGALMTLIMSSARMYFLPKLGTLTDPEERNSFFQMNAYFFLLTTALALTFLLLFADQIIYILYSDQFISASGLLMLRASTMILTAFFWIVVVSAWEKNRFNLYIISEVIRETLYVGTCLFCVQQGLGLDAVFLGFVLAEIIASFVWVGYLYFYKSELSVNPILLITIYLITFLLVYFTYNLLQKI
ncbi:hypothetical protein N9598_02110 [Gammaproteobacteria bacterium]|nr:hypothetical protein [Gammaproteobacteria bacterium]